MFMIVQNLTAVTPTAVATTAVYFVKSFQMNMDHTGKLLWVAYYDGYDKWLLRRGNH